MMQPAARDETPYLNWIWQLYDGLLNRDQTSPFLIAARQCGHATFNGARMRSGKEIVESYQALRAAVGRRTTKLDRVLFDFDVVIGPETFANCASAWWIVESTAGAEWPGNPVYGATQILFRDNKEIVQIRDVWAPLP